VLAVHERKHRIVRILFILSLGGLGLGASWNGMSGSFVLAAVKSFELASTTVQQDSTKKRDGRQPSRRTRVLQEREGQSKSSLVRQDSTFDELAAIRALPRDSSARLIQFKAVRADPISVDTLRDKAHPLYLPEPQIIQYRDVLDSTRWSYQISRTIGGWNSRIPLEFSLEEYSQLRLRRTMRSTWMTMAQAYTLPSEKKTGLGELFGKVTNIEIPVPKNPIFSIFGPNIIRLTINGGVNVTAAFRNTKNDLVASSPLGQSRNEPEFKQEVQVTVKGEIGDKLKIDADWDTKRTFEYENQLRVRYTGYADDIVQSVEGGNVSLPIASSFISSSQALFGIKAGFQFGPLKLTTVASQKKGQIKELSVSGGARPTPFEKRAPDYSRDHYFIDASYIAEYENVFLKIPAQPNPYMQVRDIEVWITKTGISYEQGEREVVAFMDVDKVLAIQNDPTARSGSFNPVTGEVEVGRFMRMEQNVDYTLNEYAGVISMNRSIQPDQAIAVAYSISDPSNTRLARDIGNFSSRDTTKSSRLALKLVKPINLDPKYKTAWRLLLKNRYPLGGRGIKKEGFELRFEYEVSGQTPLQTVLDNVSLLEMFRLDRYKEDGSPGSDGKFDYLPGHTIDETRGELVFPTLEPLSDSTIRKLLSEKLSPEWAAAAADSFSFNALYDTTYTGALNSTRNKYFIRGNFTPAIASTYSLGFNIVEGSVEVLANGQKAIANVDYTVDYITGQVVVKNQAYLTPGTNLQIRYEANDLFQLASKALLGARGDFDMGKNASLGFTIMNLNQQSLSDKVRLGEEPISNTIMGIDGGAQLDLNFLTRAMNWLPGIQTNAPSQFTIRGEAAYMLPDPNTRKSVIPQDEGKGMAYIDDFEGARRMIPLGVSYAGWKDASPPYFSPMLDDTTFLPRDPQSRLVISTTGDLITSGKILADTLKIQYKGHASWYNVFGKFYVSDIWGNRKSVGRGQEQVSVLDFHYKPFERGAYNYSMDLEGKLLSDPKKTWAGIQHLLGTTSTNLLDENVNFIELWIKIAKSQSTAKLNINLGFISEDVIPNKKLDTEDGLNGGIRNGILNEGEDVGLDGLTDDQERLVYSAFVGKYGQFSDDPSGDNYVAPPLSGILNPDLYASANGTDGNSKSQVGYYPDTEDLNRNNVPDDRINNYYEYELPLDTANAVFRKYVAGQGESGWYQIRIPINEYSRTVGSPTLTTVEGIRLWMTGAQDEVLFHLAEFNLVGNQWEELRKNDSTFKVSVVNYEDNPTYTPPAENLRTKDRTRPDENVLSNEQSLNLVIKGLLDGETKQAIKRFPIKPLDLFSYKTMKMFVHGDTRPEYFPRYVDTTNYDLEVFLRFGADSLNYYEYRAPVKPGWDPNNIVIKFEEITAIKFSRDSAGTLSKRFPLRDGPIGATFQVRGEPTLTIVRYMAIGVENPIGKGTSSYSGELWADELRLSDVDDSKGWAYRFDTGLKLADVGNIAFSYTDRDPNFHGLEERFGSRTTSRNWTLSANMGFEKFLPASWNGTSLTFSYSHVEGISAPKYLPGTDILVSEAVQRTTDNQRSKGKTPEEAQTLGEDVRVRSESFTMSESYALPTIRFVLPINSWLITETINKMVFGYSYNVTRRRDPITENAESWGWSARFGYNLAFSPNNFIEPFGTGGGSPWSGLRIFFTPRSFSLAATLNRSQANEQARSQTVARPTTRSMSSNRSMSFSWQFWEGGLLNLGTDYQVDIQSNLSHLELDQYGQQRSFTDILGDIFLSDRLVSFGIDQTYGQTIGLNTRLAMPKLLKLDKIITPNLRYSSRYDWSNNIQAGILGRSAAWGSSLTLGLDLAIKTVGEEIWSATPSASVRDAADTVKSVMNLGKQAEALSRFLIKNILFDFDRLSITFTQTNRSQNTGVLGRPGFGNIFSRVPFVQSSTIENGPSLLYQLGFSSDPHGEVVVGTKGSFPFITGYSVPGLRAPNANLADVFGQNNRVSMRTSRSLWEGASLDLNWNLGWSYNENRTGSTHSDGVPIEGSKVVSGDVDRSFMTFPPVFIFKFFKTGIEEVNKTYERLRNDGSDTRTDDAKISQAFEDGFESLPIFKKILSNIMPRVNWTLRWDGLERFPLFNTFAQRVSLDHNYTSSYRRRWKLSPQGKEVTEGQSISYGFSPLVGVNITFKNFIKGNFSGTFRYGFSTNYDLVPSIQNITEGTTTDISMTLNYSRQGFEIPFFGLSLSNDIDVSFTYSSTSNGRRLYDFKEVNFKPEGNPLEGLGRSQMEPRIRYILSSRVTASLYYKYTKVKPDAGGSRIPGSTVNEGGLDIHVTIQ